MNIWKERLHEKNILEFLKHFFSRSHHKHFFGPPCIYIYFLHLEAWVNETLVPFLEENDPRLKLCIHQRDFKV